MIIEAIHKDNPVTDYERYYRNSVPYLLRLPMDISLRILGIKSYGKLLNRKSFNIDHHDIGFNSESPKDAIITLLTSFPKFIALNILILLFKWVDLYLLKYKSNSNEIINPEILESLNSEFERTSDQFIFGRIVNRLARKQIQIIDKRNIRPNTQFNYYQSVEVIQNNICQDSRNSFVIRRFTCAKEQYQIVQLAEKLIQADLIGNESVKSFVCLFEFEETTNVYVSISRIRWKGYNQDLMFLFLMLVHYKILPSCNLSELSPRLEKYFYNRRGVALENLRKAKDRITKDNIYLQEPIVPKNKNQALIIGIIKDSFQLIN